MKRLFLIVLLFISFPLLSQEKLYESELPINEDGFIDFTDVIQVDGFNVDDLYSRAREWFVTRYNSAEDVLHMDDKGSGKLIGKAFAEVTGVSLGLPIVVKMHYTISIYLREGRYKYSISNIEHETLENKYSAGSRATAEFMIVDNLYKPNGKLRKYQASLKEATIVSIKATIADLNAFMKASMNQSEDGW